MDGIVAFGKDSKGKRKVLFNPLEGSGKNKKNISYPKVNTLSFKKATFCKRVIELLMVRLIRMTS